MAVFSFFSISDHYLSIKVLCCASNDGKPCLYHKRFSFSKIQPFFAKNQPKNRLALFSCRGYPSHMKLHTSKHVCTNFGALIRICTIVTPIYPTSSLVYHHIIIMEERTSRGTDNCLCLL